MGVARRLSNPQISPCGDAEWRDMQANARERGSLIRPHSFGARTWTSRRNPRRFFSQCLGLVVPSYFHKHLGQTAAGVKVERHVGQTLPQRVHGLFAGAAGPLQFRK